MSRLSRDVALNLAGLAFPVLVALVAIPFILRAAGVERLGFLTIAWAAIGYLGFLDFGLSRAIARRIAAADSPEALAAETALMFRFGRILFWTAGALAFAVYALLPPAWIFGHGSVNLPPSELASAWAILLATLPAILAANVWRGAMEGRRAFLPVNVYRVLLGIWTYGAPILALVWTNSLAWLVGSVALGHWLSAWLHYRWCVRELPPAAAVTGSRRRELLATLKDGAWMTVSNVVGPIIVLADRFVISSLVGLAAAAVYSIPQEVALRMLLLPGAVALSVFPRFAAGLAPGVAGDALALPERAVRLTLALMAPASLITIAIAPRLLQLWLGDDIARDGSYVLQVFALSVLVNAPASIAFILLQARGYARWPALLHLIELPLTIGILILAVRLHGIEGAAWVWFFRTLIDAVAMMLLARRLEPDIVSRRFVVGAVAAIAGGCLLMVVAHGSQSEVFLYVLSVIVVAVSMAAILKPREFAALRTFLPRAMQQR